MSYQIFLSHATDDFPIASALERVLNNAFEGAIVFFIAPRDIGSGANWRKTVRGELSQCQAILSVLTRASHERPWIIAEWSAFWLDERPFFPVLADDLPADELFEPMRDEQATRLTDVTSVKRLLFSLARLVQVERVPYGHADQLVREVAAAVERVRRAAQDASYGRYSDPAVPLPQSDADKREIVEYFLECGEPGAVSRIAREIRSDGAKRDLIDRLLELRWDEEAFRLARQIRESALLRSLAEKMIDLGLDGSPFFSPFVMWLAEQNQTEYRRVVEHAIDSRGGDLTLFHRLATHLTNNVMIRHVLVHLIVGGHAVPEGMVERLAERNRAELRNVALVMLENSMTRTEVFDRVLRALAGGTQRELEKVMVELCRQDPERFHDAMRAGIPTDPGVLERLRALDGGDVLTE